MAFCVLFAIQFLSRALSHPCFSPIKHLHLSFFKVYFYLFWERDREQAGEGQREKEIESQASSALSAQSPLWGRNSWAVQSWPEMKSRVRCLIKWATQVPEHLQLWNVPTPPLKNQKLTHLFNKLRAYYVISSVPVLEVQQWINQSFSS